MRSSIRWYWLKDEADMLFVQRDALLVLHRVNWMAKKIEFAGPHAVEHAEDGEERRLARAGWAHDRDELARSDVAGNPSQYERSTGRRFEDFSRCCASR